jgi:excisionase family DNA binding protein
MERSTDASIEELLHHEEYTSEELARLLGIGLDVVRHAAFTGELPAQMAGHDIVRIRREDALSWLEQGEDRASTPRAGRRA